MLSNHNLSQALYRLETLPGPSEAIIEDTWIWPMIRVHILFCHLRAQKKSSCYNKKANQDKSFFSSLGSKLYPKLKSTREAVSCLSSFYFLQSKIKPSQDVVSIVLPSRWKHDAMYISERDPIVGEILSELGMNGVRISLWSVEDYLNKSEPSEGIVRFGSSLSCALSLLKIRLHFLGVPTEPFWHELITQNCGDILGVNLNWNTTYKTFLSIKCMREVFYNALLKSGPRIILSSCWYGFGSMACILAAKSLGIKVIEVQHGAQENSHPFYHGWFAVPKIESVIHPFPESIMVWGSIAKSLYSDHPLMKEVVVAGLPSINKNLRALSRRPRQNLDGKPITYLSIGYTLTWPLEPLIADLQAAIKSCPVSWSWVLRLHPSDSKGENLLKLFISENPGLNVRISKSSEHALVDFFESIDVHLSHESSCSLQALALGMPTLITTAQGAKNFKGWIDQAVMMYHSQDLKMYESIQKLIMIDPSTVIEASREIFGTHSDFNQAMSYLNASLE